MLNLWELKLSKKCSYQDENIPPMDNISTRNSKWKQQTITEQVHLTF